MAADVSSMVRVLSGYKEEKHRTLMGDESNDENSTTLITRDLLGGSLSFEESQELDLDSQVPTGWGKRLDLKSGKVHVQKCNTLSLTQMSGQWMTNSTVPKLEDHIFAACPTKLQARVFDETNLELELVSSSMPSSNYQSVCTLDKVKSALERAEKDPTKKRMSFWKPLLSSPSPSYSSSSSSLKENQEDDKEKMASSPIAIGCPGCLSYILIMKHNPICPRCNSVVPFPLTKKPRIDLNL